MAALGPAARLWLLCLRAKANIATSTGGSTGAVGFGAVDGRATSRGDTTDFDSAVGTGAGGLPAGGSFTTERAGRGCLTGAAGAA